jgi:hypothetical protein
MLAVLAVLAGPGLGASPVPAAANLPGGGPAGPSQAWLLPVKAPGPFGTPAILSGPLPAYTDALRAQSSPRVHGDPTSLDPPSSALRSVAHARRATLTQRGSVLNRITLSPHAPPIAA